MPWKRGVPAHLGFSAFPLLLATGGWGAFAYGIYAARQQDRTFRDEVAWAWLRVRNSRTHSAKRGPDPTGRGTRWRAPRQIWPGSGLGHSLPWRRPPHPIPSQHRERQRQPHP